MRFLGFHMGGLFDPTQLKDCELLTTTGGSWNESESGDVSLRELIKGRVE